MKGRLMTSTSTTPKASGVPEGYRTVTPFVIVKGAAKFIEFTKQAFDAEEMTR
jgi:PhnB protein